MQLFRKNIHFHNTEMAVKDLLDDIKKANGIASVLSYEKLVGEFQSKKNLADPGEEKAREKADPSVDTRDKVKNLPAKDKDALLVTTKDLKEAASESTEAANTAAGTDPNWRAMMDYCDGRLLLHTLANPTTTRMSMQMPHEVFLELGVGDKCLGRIYIRLWCHLCRAQQLLALCMGTMGPSLLKAKASDKMGNLIVFRSAVDRDNKSVSHALLTGLEWGGQHSKPETEGLVTGIVSNNLAFGICIQRQTGTSVNAAFGVVVAGHEVTKAAFQHNPVSEVTITSCGLVMPGFSQEG
ncbi:uncharacterized protein LOC123507222 [Portunus trituberculatus]|nr:uncharacterized protein LOC123507222 [Portunus trituberculatus]XP_045115865.1 uncharacterized protein LOC123507222 [Portunus trituberculatus]XP_045115866.1 uncharacterized protein LOC123507222 [Portunus trituberculatus]XP_045115868.1 uncharacterized protein LOC123507222 [Portunus trituberculatus]XP_045115869.1 uncharacterized protein LOC123507222 [Portunus trituberculatus]XP_045115870.1 uncharacterized protein LOC123507222 [Portunus trituberculatus]